jgi:hypothetical protein
LGFDLSQRQRHRYLRHGCQSGGGLGFSQARTHTRLSLRSLRAHRGLVRHLRRGGESGDSLGARGGGPVCVRLPEQNGVCLCLPGAAVVCVCYGYRRQRRLVPGQRRRRQVERALSS